MTDYGQYFELFGTFVFQLKYCDIISDYFGEAHEKKPAQFCQNVHINGSASLPQDLDVCLHFGVHVTKSQWTPLILQCNTFHFRYSGSTMFCLLQHLDVTLLEKMNSAFSDVCHELLQWQLSVQLSRCFACTSCRTAAFADCVMVSQAESSQLNDWKC